MTSPSAAACDLPSAGPCGFFAKSAAVGVPDGEALPTVEAAGGASTELPFVFAIGGGAVGWEALEKAGNSSGFLVGALAREAERAALSAHDMGMEGAAKEAAAASADVGSAALGLLTPEDKFGGWAGGGVLGC